MIFSFWIELQGATKLWVASIFFTLLGAVIAWVFPLLFPAIGRDPLVSFAIGALGWAFIGLGLLVFVSMLGTLYIRATRPGHEEVWHWWINFAGGLAGALLFAVPATLMLPVFCVAYLRRPNVLFPSDAAAANNLWIAALFSVIGLVVLAVIRVLVRLKLRENPKRGARSAVNF